MPEAPSGSCPKNVFETCFGNSRLINFEQHGLEHFSGKNTFLHKENPSLIFLKCRSEEMNQNSRGNAIIDQQF